MNDPDIRNAILSLDTVEQLDDDDLLYVVNEDGASKTIEFSVFVALVQTMVVQGSLTVNVGGSGGTVAASYGFTDLQDNLVAGAGVTFDDDEAEGTRTINVASTLPGASPVVINQQSGGVETPLTINLEDGFSGNALVISPGGVDEWLRLSSGGDLDIGGDLNLQNTGRILSGNVRIDMLGDLFRVYASGPEYFRVSATETLVNSGRRNHDFSWSSDTLTRFFFCDATNNRIGIGQSNQPNARLDVLGDHVRLSAPSADLSAGMENNQLSWHIDEAGPSLKLTVRDSTGTTRTATLPLI